MAVKNSEWKIVANKNSRKLANAKLLSNGSPYSVGTAVWFIGNELRLFEWKVTSVERNGYYKCSVQNKNIHQPNEWQTAVVSEDDLHLLKT